MISFFIRVFIFAFIFLLPKNEAHYEIQQDAKPICPPEGAARKGKKPLSEEEKEFNRRKNVPSDEPEWIAETLPLEEFLQGKKGVKDREDWNEGAYVEINDAYLIDYKEQKGESCNCYYGDTSKWYSDVHINIGNKNSLIEKINDHFMVVEITPSFKSLHKDYKLLLKQLKGKKVTIRGYLFYDDEHERNSLNYCKTCSEKGVWRKTCWEIHPITYIGLCE